MYSIPVTWDDPTELSLSRTVARLIRNINENCSSEGIDWASRGMMDRDIGRERDRRRRMKYETLTYLRALASSFHYLLDSKLAKKAEDDMKSVFPTVASFSSILIF